MNVQLLNVNEGDDDDCEWEELREEDAEASFSTIGSMEPPGGASTMILRSSQ